MSAMFFFLADERNEVLWLIFGGPGASLLKYGIEQLGGRGGGARTRSAL